MGLKRLLFIRRLGGHNHFLPKLVDGLNRDGLHNFVDLCLAVDFINSIGLDRRRGHFHAQNDVSNFRLGQSRDIHIIFLPVISKN